MKKMILMCIFIGSINTIFASEEHKDKVLFDVNDQTFEASQPWGPIKSAIITGMATSLAVATLLGTKTKLSANSIGLASLNTGMITGLAMGIRQSNYEKVYNKAEGLTVYGAAAANNARGTYAWIEHKGKKILLEQDSSGKIPLIYASGNGATDATNVILAVMPEQEEVLLAKTPFLWELFATIIVLAGYTGPSVTIVGQEIYQYKNPVDKQDDKGRTALHYAALGQHLEVMRLLYRNGADVRIKDKEGMNLQQLAKSNHAVQNFLTNMQ
jgi:hypothetical protein